jgi:hypothetical protein
MNDTSESKERLSNEEIDAFLMATKQMFEESIRDFIQVRTLEAAQNILQAAQVMNLAGNMKAATMASSGIHVAQVLPPGSIMN